MDTASALTLIDEYADSDAVVDMITSMLVGVRDGTGLKLPVTSQDVVSVDNSPLVCVGHSILGPGVMDAKLMVVVASSLGRPLGVDTTLILAR